jgi:hypothetical protein
MKRLVLFLFLFVTSYCAMAQMTDAGIITGFGITRYHNINLSNRRPDLNPEINFAPMIGIHADHFFTPEIAIELEADYSFINQKYDGNISSTITFNAKDEVRYFEIPLLFEYTESNIYAEIGPKISVLTGGVGDFETTPSSSDDYSNLDIKNGFNSLVVSAVLGAGTRLNVAKNIILQAGFRLGYGLTDATKQIPPDQYFPLYSANKLGVTSKYAHLGIGAASKYDYRFTTLITGDLLVSVCYKFQ